VKTIPISFLQHHIMLKSRRGLLLSI